MSTRKTHNKTRLGCRQCKKRRIKCDGKHPTCVNCEKRHLECSFLLLAPSTLLSAARPPTTEVTVSPRTPSAYRVSVFKQIQSPSTSESSTPEPTDSFSGLVLPDVNRIPRFIKFDDVWKDCRECLAPQLQTFLYHYEYTTSLTLAADDPAKTAWRSFVPELASHHQFLVHCVLAIASLHLSRLHEGKAKKRAMAAVAATQMNKALTSYRRQLENVNESNASALFACATLTAVYLFRTSAMDIEATRATVPVGTIVPPTAIVDRMMQSVIKTFWGIRGAHTVLRPGWDWVVGGKMSPICARKWWPKNRGPASERAINEDKRLCQIEHLWIRPGQDYQSHFDALSEALLYLRDTFALVSQFTVPDSKFPAMTAVPYLVDDNTVGMLKDRGAVFVWAAWISREFVTLVEQKNREALVIFAHYAVLPARIRNVWWLEGLGANMVMAAGMALGQENWHLIEWPAQVVGVDLEDAFGSRSRKDDVPESPDELHMQVI